MRSALLRVTRVQCAALVALAGAAAAPLEAQIPQTPQPPATTLSSIRVTGDAKVSSRPDRVQISIGVQSQAASSDEAASANARQLETVLAAVRKAAGSTGALRTVSYALNPNYQYHPNGGEPTITGYTALNVVEVTLDDLGRMGNVIDAATHNGANRIQGIQFTLKDQDAARAQALREAAQPEADVLAGALGLKVLRVLTVEESSPRFIPQMVHVTSVRAGNAAAEAPTPVESGTLDVSAEVALSVEVGPAAR
jgi:uncharacterized protein YggE